MNYFIMTVLVLIIIYLKIAMRDKNREIDHIYKRMNKIEYKLKTLQDEDAVDLLNSKWRMDKKVDYWVEL
jgi:hypothetical protein